MPNLHGRIFPWTIPEVIPAEWPQMMTAPAFLALLLKPSWQRSFTNMRYLGTRDCFLEWSMRGNTLGLFRVPMLLEVQYKNRRIGLFLWREKEDIFAWVQYWELQIFRGPCWINLRINNCNIIFGVILFGQSWCENWLFCKSQIFKKSILIKI